MTRKKAVPDTEPREASDAPVEEHEHPDPDADPGPSLLGGVDAVDGPPTAAGELRALRRGRRSKRVAEIEWFEAAYRVYLTAIVGVVAILLVSSWLGDQPASPAAVADVAEYGPAVLGVLAAGALALGLRSGSRGGPLAVEPAEVRHVLLAPVDRRTALLGHALRQLRYACFVGTVVGGIAGHQAHRKLPGSTVAWIVCGAVAGLAVALTLVGAALLSNGLRLRPWVATLVGVAFVAWAVADVMGGPASPTSFVTGIALWPLDTASEIAVRGGAEVGDVVGPVVAAALAAVGLALLGRTSLEALERRTSIVGQLRFAVTMQDLRTVIVLRRQLALDRPRDRPWVRVPGGRRWPVWRRGWHGFARFPAVRLGRLVVLAAALGVALGASLEGARALVVVAGLVAFLLGLDLIEPLAQEVDQSPRTDSFPTERGRILYAHAAAPAVLGTVLGAAVVGGGALVVQGGEHLTVIAIAAVPAVLAGIAGAAVSTVMGAPTGGDDSLVMPPEVAGMKIAIRTGWPLVVAVLGTVPVLAAASASNRTPVSAAVSAVFLPLLLVFLTVGWLRFRDDAHAWFRKQSEVAKQQQGRPTGATP